MIVALGNLERGRLTVGLYKVKAGRADCRWQVDCEISIAMGAEGV
jgi:hypothetical protein